MLHIREERPAEYRATENLVREAFFNVYAPGCCEHYVLHRLRKSPDLVPELNLVAEQDGRLVGQVIAVRAHIAGDDGLSHEVLCLGPIAVLPEFQNQSIGGRLLAAIKERAHCAGFRAILLCGNPAYYSRHGFESAERYGIRTAENMWAEALQVCPLHEGALTGLAGRYYESPAYQVEAQDVEEFDRAFPQKAKVTGTSSQQLFVQIVSRCRPYLG